MNLGDIVLGVVGQVPGMIPGLTVDIQTELVNTGIDPATNKPYNSTVIDSKGYKAVIAELTNDERNNAALKLTELKLDVFCNGDTINTNCVVKLNRGQGVEVYEIIDNLLTMAGSVPALNSLFLKK